MPRVDLMPLGVFGEYLHWVLGPTRLVFLMRMVYSPCGLAYSLFKISCPLGRYLKAVCNPRMDVDSLSAYDCAHPSAE